MASNTTKSNARVAEKSGEEQKKMETGRSAVHTWTDTRLGQLSKY